ncbi:hypothetical protein [Nostoc sp. JL23]|uniref:hypothetical protein n=1 Tax=Nostoc sp. JL23 TaxID=2815394 RepID=UPI001D2BF740|nr:hypothetical protein [Nostoc sp. JL23]MBN3875245.1 hypothetical protein [Nostoc sp. JL23]
MAIQTGYAIASIAALKALTSSQRADSYARLVKSVGWYMFDASSTATGDDDLVLLPDDNPSTGRWIKIGGSGGGGGGNINFTGSIICTSSCGASQGKAFHFDSPQSGFIQIVVDPAIASIIYTVPDAIQISLWTQEPNTAMTGRQFVAELPKAGGSVFISTDDYRPWISVQARNLSSSHDGVCCTFGGNTVTLLTF